MHSLVRLLPRCLFALALAACAGSQKHAPEAGRARSLTIVGINDTHGALLPTPAPRWLQSSTSDEVGGADWFAGWMNAVRAEARSKGGEVLILDAGDEFQGTLISNQFQGRSVTDVYDAVGVAASALGNHEFDFGVPALRERMAQARYPILAANVFRAGTRERPDWLKPSVLLEVGGVKVGVIGLATVDTPLTTNPVNLAGLEFVPGGPVAAQEADALRAQGATVVLITAHAGPLPPGNEIRRVAEACQGKVDAIVSGHQHTAIGPPPLVVAGIPIVQSGSKLVSFSVIELALDDAGHARGFSVNDGTQPTSGGPQAILHAVILPGGRREPVSWRGRQVAPDERVAAILRDYDGQVRKLRETRVGETTVDLRKGGGDDLLGNLTADALRSGAGGGLPADFAFQNSGGLRINEIPAGPITFGQLFDLVPFDNEQLLVTLSAQEVRDALEAVVRAGKGPMRVSGMRYQLDWKRFAGAARDAKDLPRGALVTRVIEDGGAPICETKSCSKESCEAVCADRKYKVAVTDFLANGGDGLEMLKGAPRQMSSVLGRDMLVSYVKAHQPLTPEALGSVRAGKPPRWTQIGSAPRAQTGE
jgi:5'-nucleotidase